MSYASKHAAIATIAWLAILIGLVLVVVIPGASTFADAEHGVLRLITALIILPGFILNAWYGVKTAKGKKKGDIDERDIEIARRSSEITLVVLAITTFLASLLLYEMSVETGTVSRGWLYLMAYGSVSIVSLVHAASFLILDRQGWTNA
jgi:uncharacterized membrane protein